MVKTRINLHIWSDCGLLWWQWSWFWRESWTMELNIRTTVCFSNSAIYPLLWSAIRCALAMAYSVLWYMPGYGIHCAMAYAGVWLVWFTFATVSRKPSSRRLRHDAHNYPVPILHHTHLPTLQYTSPYPTNHMGSGYTYFTIPTYQMSIGSPYLNILRIYQPTNTSIYLTIPTYQYFNIPHHTPPTQWVVGTHTSHTSPTKWVVCAHTSPYPPTNTWVPILQYTSPYLADCPFFIVCWHSRKWWPPLCGGTL